MGSEAASILCLVPTWPRANLYSYHCNYYYSFPLFVQYLIASYCFMFVLKVTSFLKCFPVKARSKPSDGCICSVAEFKQQQLSNSCLLCKLPFVFLFPTVYSVYSGKSHVFHGLVFREFVLSASASPAVSLTICPEVPFTATSVNDGL